MFFDYTRNVFFWEMEVVTFILVSFIGLHSTQYDVIQSRRVLKDARNATPNVSSLGF